MTLEEVRDRSMALDCLQLLNTARTQVQLVDQVMTLNPIWIHSLIEFNSSLVTLLNLGLVHIQMRIQN